MDIESFFIKYQQKIKVLKKMEKKTQSNKMPLKKKLDHLSNLVTILIKILITLLN